MNVSEKNRKQEILELLRHTEHEIIFSFVAEYAEEDERFYERMNAALLPADNEVCDIDYYKVKAEDCFEFDPPYRGRTYHYDFYEAAYEAASGLDKILDDAAFFEKQGKSADAAAMAMAVAEVVPRNYEHVDDSDGGLSLTFETAIKLLCDIVNNPAAAVSVKNEIYDWSKKESKDTVYSDYGMDEIQTIYETCCDQLGDTDQVLADIEKQIETSNEYYKSKAVLRKIRFMQLRNIDTQDVIQKHIDLDDVRKIRFAQLVNDKKYDEALLVARRGIEIAQQQNHHQGTVTDWQKSMFDIHLLQGDTAKLLPMAEYLFQHAGWSYSRDEFYDALKKYTPAADWTNTMERLLATAERERGYDSFAARIMREHQLWSRLFAHCQKGSISAMEEYENDLKPHFEQEILEHYREIVEKKAQITDQRAYDEVARILKRMKTFTEGNDMVNQLLEKYRATYKRRKNMMAALNGV